MDDLTPMAVERRLRELTTELAEATKQYVEAEHTYAKAKPAYEIVAARWRMSIRKNAAENGVRITIQEVEDEALLRCATEYTELYAAEATIKALKANIQRINAQIDVGRSLGVSVRKSMEAM